MTAASGDNVYERMQRVFSLKTHTPSSVLAGQDAAPTQVRSSFAYVLHDAYAFFQEQKPKEGEGQDEVMFSTKLLTHIARAYKALCSYECEKCIKLLYALPQRHFFSGWVQQQV
jgi:hypothetical protein